MTPAEVCEPCALTDHRACEHGDCTCACEAQTECRQCGEDIYPCACSRARDDWKEARLP